MRLPAVSGAHRGREGPKVSGRQIPVSQDGVFTCCAGVPDACQNAGSVAVNSTIRSSEDWVWSSALREVWSVEEDWISSTRVRFASARSDPAPAIDPAMRSEDRRDALSPQPRGSRPSIAALTMSGARKATATMSSGSTARSCPPLRRSLRSSRWESDSSLSSQRCAWRIASMRRFRAPWGMGTSRRASSLAPWMTSRLR